MLVGGKLYLKGATGGFAEVPAALAGSVYDPSAILDPDKGVAKVLASVTEPDASPAATATAWVVTGTVPAGGGRRPGARVSSTDVAGAFTIAMATGAADRGGPSP